MQRAPFIISALTTLSVTFHASAQAERIIDSNENRVIIEESLSAACISTMADDVLLCTATQMEATRSLSEAFSTYLSLNTNDTSAQREINADCTANFRAIDLLFEQTQIQQGYETALSQYFEFGFRGSLKCLQTIENIADRNGLDYMPSVRRVLHNMINDAQNGRILPKINI